MNRAGVGVAFVLLVSLGNAISDNYSRGDDPVRYQGAGGMLAAGSGGNPWALPEPRRGDSRLPEYITNPKYATEEDRKTRLDYGGQQNSSGNSPQQQVPQGYGAPLGQPAVPNVYMPYSGTPYGYQPVYPMYPGFGGLPGLGTPYMGDPGFGGNPLLTPYGNIYGTGVPYQGSGQSSDE